MAKRLLDRQASLIEHLTSAGAIYGGGAGLPDALQGIDPALLRVEARFSHEKRMEKIAAVFPRTMALLAADAARIVQAFAAACPPTDISRIENARQFHGFLAWHWRREPPPRPDLPDVAACELALAALRVDADDLAAAGKGIRRRPDVALWRCGFDVRPVLEGDESAAPVERDTPLAISLDPQTQALRTLELEPELFALLAALDDWTDAAVVGESPEAAELIAGLVDAGLLELRR